MSSTLRLLVVDDHVVVRVSLVAWLQTVPHVSVVGEAGTVAGAVVEAIRCQPDVILMDVRLSDGSGIEACRRIRAQQPDARIVMLTSYADEEAVVSSIMAGATAYILKETEPERLIEAIEAAVRGEMVLSAAPSEAMRDWMRRQSTRRAADPLERLNASEQQILALIAEGRTNAAIAVSLNYSQSTIKGQVSSILRKLQLSRRSEAAAYLVRHTRAVDG